MSSILTHLDQEANRSRFSDFNMHLTELSRVDKINQVTSVELFLGMLGTGEVELANAILHADPAELGLRTPPVDIEPVPSDIVIIDNIDHVTDSVEGRTLNQYLPKPVYERFMAMQAAYAADQPGRQLILESGYRSPAYQVVTFVHILVRVYEFDLARTLQRVALPDCSQHCLATRTALDIANIDGEPGSVMPQDFAKSIEYDWLQTNAAHFDFYESYPMDNSDGIMWEPWHWQYRPPVDAGS